MFNYMKYSREPIIGNPELGVLFFGVFYLMYRGLWLHAILMAVLVIPTLGLSWIWYIFKTRRYLTRRYAEQGFFDEKMRADLRGW